MIGSIGVVVGTFGDQKWADLAQNRALPSAQRQTLSATDVIHVHGSTLHEARNEGAERLNSEHVVFLDADDELDEHYLEAMSRAIERSMIRSDHKTFLYQPSTLGIVDGREDAAPVLIPQRPLHTGNFMVIGTAVQRALFRAVGGFQAWPAWEDWALWMRCGAAGAGVITVPDAIYRVHVSTNSRNAAVANDGRLFEQILASHRQWAIEWEMVNR